MLITEAIDQVVLLLEYGARCKLWAQRLHRKRGHES